MMDRFRVSSVLARRLEDVGLPPAKVFRHAGLPETLFQAEKIYLTTEELFALYRGIAEVSGEPDIGLKLGTEERLERYDPVAIAALCTRTFRDALQRMARYKQLTCPEKIEIQERGDECVVHFKWLLANEEEPALLVDLCFAWMMAVARRGIGAAISPKRVELQRVPAHREMYEAHFGCPVKFSAERNLLVFRKEDVERNFLTHNAELLAMVAPQLENELRQQMEQKSLSEQVKGILKRLLAGQRAGLQDVARELRVSTRTLQRRLNLEKVTFQGLIGDARRELARHYLQHSALELNETAYLLGYEDANSFFRAFHNWEGVTPGEWRSAHTRHIEMQPAESRTA
jgi:AraC-like DNA-binding protein